MAVAADRIELIEKVESARILHCLEYETQFGSRLAHELGDKPVEPDGEERQMQFVCKRRGRRRFAGAGRAEEQQLAARLKTVIAKLVLLAVLKNDPLEYAPLVVRKR